MAHAIYNDTPSTYRLAGSCSVRAYVNCDDTPYHLEQPVTVTLPSNYDADLMGKVHAIRATRECSCMSFRIVKAAILAHPEATVSELVNLLNQ